jgi:hypothetical protein
MTLSDVLNKVKEWAGKNPDKADQVVDKGSTMVRGRFAGHDEQINAVGEKAKGYLHGEGQPDPKAQTPREQAPPEQRRP